MSNIYYHYCSVDTFSKIIQSKCLRLTSFKKMNDSSEISDLDHILDEFTSSLNCNNIDPKFIKLLSMSYQTTREKNYSRTYLTCFSKEKDLLSQWRGYADNATGIAIGIDIDKLNISTLNVLDKTQCILCNTILYSDVLYDDSTKKNLLSKIYDTFLSKYHSASDIETEDMANLENALDKLSVICKNNAFSEEKELRLIFRNVVNDTYVYPVQMDIPDNISYRKYFTRDKVLVPYHDLDLSSFWTNKIISEIVLGPKCKIIENDGDFLNFLADNGLSNVKITTSNSTYR